MKYFASFYNNQYNICSFRPITLKYGKCTWIKHHAYSHSFYTSEKSLLNFGMEEWTVDKYNAYLIENL